MRLIRPIDSPLLGPSNLNTKSLILSHLRNEMENNDFCSSTGATMLPETYWPKITALCFRFRAKHSRLAGFEAVVSRRAELPW